MIGSNGSKRKLRPLARLKKLPYLAMYGLFFLHTAQPTGSLLRHEQLHLPACIQRRLWPCCTRDASSQEITWQLQAALVLFQRPWNVLNR